MEEETTTRPERAGCPHLGLAVDPSSHRSEPTLEHRCHAGTVPFAVDEERQSYYCLSDIFDLCPRRVLGVPLEIPEPEKPEKAEKPEKRAEVIENPEPAAEAPSRRPGHRLPVLVGVACVVGGAAFALATVWNQGQSSPPVTAPDSAPTVVEAPAINPTPAQVKAEPSPAPTRLAPTPAPSPSAIPGNSLAGGSLAGTTPTAIPPTPVPPAPAPTDQPPARTYLVPRGDTLTSISRQFGVPIEDIMKANGIVDRNLILTGRTLVIPEPR